MQQILTFLAIDLGASSGRIVAIQFDTKQNTSELSVVYRFSHNITHQDGYMCWDLEHIKSEILKGLSLCSELKPTSIAVDTWAVDIVLKDEDNNYLMPAVSYRDPRTKNIVELFHKESGISIDDCFKKTGIHPFSFNTLYQLYSIKKSHPKILKRTHRITLLADELTSFLCEYDGCEYTNASSTQLINYQTKSWDKDLLESISVSSHQFGELHEPGIVVGNIYKHISQKTGLSPNTIVVSTASHDTASAVEGAFLTNNTCFLNLGTWTLLGTTSEFGFFDPEDLENGWSNEALNKKYYRPLRNIMGQWIVTKFKEDINDTRSFDQITSTIANLSDYQYIIDVNNFIFFNPANMKEAIDKYLVATGQTVPKNIDEYYKLIYENLAFCYDYYIAKLSKKTDIQKLHIIGGGTQDKFSIPLITKLTGLEVFLGSSEATAVGNIYLQAKALGMLNQISLNKFMPKLFAQSSQSNFDDIKNKYLEHLKLYKGIKL